MNNNTQKHSFHLVDPSPWPLLTAFSVLILLFGTVLYTHSYINGGFAWTLMSLNGFFSLIHYVPLSILVVLFILETGVAVIQAFVFAVLFCIYINDVLNLH